MAQIQRVPASILPNFHGLENEGPDEFLFQLEILCRGYENFSSYLERSSCSMVHEPRWELHSNLGRYETYILKMIGRLLQSQGGNL